MRQQMYVSLTEMVKCICLLSQLSLSQRTQRVEECLLFKKLTRGRLGWDT